MLRGIDISGYQKNIDWEKVKNSGVEFAIIKLGNIIDDAPKFTIDNYFKRNYNECKRLGIPIGLYVYNYINDLNNIRIAANKVIAFLKNYKIQLPIYLDMEDASIAKEGRNKLTQMTIEFNTIVEEAGYWAGVYANLNWFNNYLNKNEIKKRYTTWIAHYGVNEERYKNEYDMLQYSSSGRVNGIYGNVDVNIMYRNLIYEINKEDKYMEELYNQYGKDTVDKALKRLIETFIDDANPSGWAEKEVKEAKDMGITDATNPQMFATRQEVMMMVKRGVDIAVKKSKKEEV